ncbi:ATP-binding protein [Enterobacter sp. BIDMC 29]|uniref:ATP-binding protein n=1 Tax=Enterobacter sp. BIDMC 29 TaxID=1329841 RepID=UPI0026F3F628|nr:ATP-binding protein [Enterobacter sp. BIDMC 29]
MEDRYQRGSTIIISQLPVSEWYKLVGNPTVADALIVRARNRNPSDSQSARFSAHIN